jgi:hypothetical protein
MRKIPLALLVVLVNLALLGCSSSLTLQRSAAPLETKMGPLKTGAYAVVNSPKQDGETYLAKTTRTFAPEGKLLKVSLDPVSFKNAYSFVEFSLGKVAGNKISELKILLQGENFSDGYVVQDASKGGVLECDGSVGHLTFKGVAESKITAMQEPVDLQFYFELPPSLKEACK